jgi:PAS domain S-box-containing protein
MEAGHMQGMIFSLDNYSFNINAVPPLAAAVATLFVGLFVIIREKGSRVSILFLIYDLTVFLWLFSFAMARFSPVEQVVFWWAKALHVGLALLPAALYHFTVVVLQTYQKRRRSVWVLWAVGAFFLGVVLFTNALFDGFYHYSWGPYTKYKWFGVPFILYHFIMMVAILRFYAVEYRRSAQSTMQHRRAKALFLAFCIGYLASLDILPTLGVPYHPLGVFPMLVLLVLVTRVIWRYRLVDITPAFAAHQIIDTMSDALLVLDQEGVIRLTNRAAACLFDRSEQEMTGKPVSTIICDPLFSTHIEKVNSSGGINNFELACYPRKDSMVILSLSASVLRDRAGKPAGTVCVARDITDKKKMEEDRLKSQKLESLGVLAGGIAHDFNNLLTGILGNISLARQYVQRRDAVDRRLLEAEKASLWAKDLTQQLLTFSRGGAPVRKTASIGAVIRDSAELALRGTRNRAEFHIPGDLWFVDVDEGQMRQVIQNLVINADQAMPQGGTIEVRCENTTVAGDDLPVTQGKYVRVSIRDRGIGIPKEHLQKIFDPYFTTKQKGSGLGLATAYSIVKNHDGFIRVESEPAEGTVFHVYLSASQKEPPVERRRETELFAGKGKILIMDDEELMRAVVSEMLRHLGYTVEVANDGHEAIRKYAAARESRNPFDIVILDLTVPGGMGGSETVQRLREIDPHVKAIVSSGYSQDTVMSDFEQHGFAGVVPKPFKIAELSEAMHNAMKTRLP